MRSNKIKNNRRNTIFNIYGGNNQILPNATEAIQNFYNVPSKVMQPDKEVQTAQDKENLEKKWLNAELAKYIGKEYAQEFQDRVSQCRSIPELAEALVDMRKYGYEHYSKDIVKKEFINLLLRFVPQIEKGRTPGNIRARINDALASYRKKYNNRR